ncbi:hypothetical protein IJH23_01250 [Candidatus Saccharibacteria bacterium]|nr:hypothetical protein [Candidatus Saccharibacteria bacterium]
MQSKTHICILVIILSIFIAILILNDTKADSIVSEASITVPVSCSLSSLGTNNHTATILNGASNSNIGSTTLKAFCNDNEGFAIYAVGFTGDEFGKNVLTSSSLGSTHDIQTGTALTGNSQWAMKLEATSGATYPITIQNDFDNFHTVPSASMMVAKREASTDVGINAEGTTLTTTYQAYISATQPAGTYVGKVKYILVHPAIHPAPKPEVTRDFELTYGNNQNLFFDEEKTQNQNVVTYSATCETETKQFEIMRTSNIDNSGVQLGSYTDEEIIENFVFHGASKIKIVVNYGYTAGTGGVYLYIDDNNYDDIYSVENNLSGEEIYIFDTDRIHIELFAENTENVISNYDYGAYLTITPLDESDNELSYEALTNCRNLTTINGTYLEPTYVAQQGLAFESWLYESYYYHLFDEGQVLDKISRTNHFSTSLSGNHPIKIDVKAMAIWF